MWKKHKLNNRHSLFTYCLHSQVAENYPGRCSDVCRRRLLRRFHYSYKDWGNIHLQLRQRAKETIIKRDCRREEKRVGKEMEETKRKREMSSQPQAAQALIVRSYYFYLKKSPCEEGLDGGWQMSVVS